MHKETGRVTIIKPQAHVIQICRWQPPTRHNYTPLSIIRATGGYGTKSSGLVTFLISTGVARSLKLQLPNGLVRYLRAKGGVVLAQLWAMAFLDRRITRERSTTCISSRGMAA